MRFSRARYVTLCQQSLVTGAVLVVGISAAGVKTLEIVPSPGGTSTAVGPEAARAPLGAVPPLQTPPGRTPAGGTTPTSDRTPAPSAGATPPSSSTVTTTRVDTAPVTPTVREVKVAPLPSARRAPLARQADPHAGHDHPEGADGSHEAAAPEKGPTTLVALSAPQRVTGYGTVGVTWKRGVSYEGQSLVVQIRTRSDERGGTAGPWSAWDTLSHDEEDGPDAGSADLGPRSRPGTDALVVGDVDEVQMRASTTDGSVPPDLELAVIDPGTGPTKQAAAAQPGSSGSAPASSTGSTASTGQDGSAGTGPQSAPAPGAAGAAAADTVTLSAARVAKRAVAMPRIYTRAEWGANESLRDQSNPSYGTVKAGFIHHTVNANNYTSAQVPSLLRGIYAYHTQSRGWRDIGYNYLVDRFGRIWEGRWGGITKAVVGAHTLGYNEVSFAMSAIGNYDITQPPQAVLDAYARLYAWKLSLYGIRADATHLWVKDRYLNAINGHRDVGQTACPGRYLYAKIPAIRALAQKYQDAGGGPATPTPTPTPTPAPTPTSPMTSPTQKPLAWSTQSTGMTFPRVSSLTGTTHPDLVLQRASDGLVRVVPMGGQVGFGAPVSTPGHWSTMNLVAAVGDVTGDGRGDVLARLAKDGSTRVYVGDGKGRVAVPGTNPTRVFRTAVAMIAAGDWNRDGKADVLVVDSAKRLYLVPGRGKGLFGSPVRLSSSWGSWTSTAVPGDLTGDGRPDVTALGRDGSLYLFPSTSTGGLGAGKKIRSLGTGVSALAGGAGDMSGDSTGDLVVRSRATGDTAVLTGVRGGQVGDVLGWFPGTIGLTSLTAGPMAGSTQSDLVGVNKAGTALVVLPHNGMSNLKPGLASTLKVPAATQVMGVGDWNGDGKGDLITREGSGDTLVLRAGRGNGTFAAPVTMAKGWRTFTVLAPVGDVTGDRKPDLAGRTASGAMTIFPGNGKTGFLVPRTAPRTLRTFNLIGSGSWTPGSASSTLLGSNGGFVPTNGSLGGNPAAWNWILGPGDVDGDGRADVVARGTGGKLWLLPGTPTGVGPKRLIGSGFAGYRLIG